VAPYINIASHRDPEKSRRRHANDREGVFSIRTVCPTMAVLEPNRRRQKAWLITATT